MIKIKICGITNLDDAMAATDAGADALGFNFYPKSPRYLEPARAAEIIGKLPPFVTPVGIFVNESESRVRDSIFASGIKVIQLHGDEPPEFCRRFGFGSRVIRAFQVKDRESIEQMAHFQVSSLLLDSYREGLRGGTGATFDWHLAVMARSFGRIILAGGLTPENVAEAVRLVRPYGVDVAGGVERRKGIKDHQKIEKFIAEVRRASQS